jgi:glycosyltransferase involved in cell wall biosynthesis
MPSSVRVLLLVENNSYPLDFRVRREAHALRDAGYQVAVIAPRTRPQPWTEEIEGIHVYRFPAPPSGKGVIAYAVEFGYATLAMLLLTGWISIRKGVDVIHAANPPDTLCLIGIVFKMFGKRFVFDQHDLAPEVYLSRFSQPRANLIHKILCLAERLSYAAADVAIVTNESYKKIAIERGSMPPDKVFIVRNGPPLSYCPLDPDPGLAERADYLIGYIGTIGPQDGLDYWMRAIREMVFTLGRRNFLAIVIGDGDALSSVKSLAKELEVEAYVLFTGRLSEVESRKYLSAVDVCVQPDPLSPLNDKSTMNKLMEYMALGKPTVAFDLVETRFSAQDAAFYVQPNDELEFAEKVVWLLDNPDESRKMGEIGRKRVATALAWEYSVPELLRAYNEDLGFFSRLSRETATATESSPYSRDLSKMPD